MMKCITEVRSVLAKATMLTCKAKGVNTNVHDRLYSMAVL